MRISQFPMEASDTDGFEPSTGMDESLTKALAIRSSVSNDSDVLSITNLETQKCAVTAAGTPNAKDHRQNCPAARSVALRTSIVQIELPGQVRNALVTTRRLLIFRANIAFIGEPTANENGHASCEVSSRHERRVKDRFSGLLSGIGGCRCPDRDT
jgi:hypothetical protein